MLLGNCAVLAQNWNCFLSYILDFCLNNFCLEKPRILKKIFFDKIHSRIFKNGLTYKFCTILEWNKCQQFADFIKFVKFWFSFTQMCKTFVQFFLDQTLDTYDFMFFKQNINSCKIWLLFMDLFEQKHCTNNITNNIS